jgi:hypothetical protein
MAIIKQLNKKTGITYVYESHSFRDKETKQPRSTRKLIGRIDDATGEIIPTRKKTTINTTSPEHGNDITTSNDDVSVSLDIVKEKDAIITEQRRQISVLLKEKEELAKELERLVEKLHQ